MITETAYIESSTTTKSATMVATTDQSTDFANCENKSETLNVCVTNSGNYTSFRTATKVNNNNETENELDFDSVDTDTDELCEYGRPKKLQKSLIGDNIINQIDSDYNLKTATKSSGQQSDQIRFKSNGNKLLTNNDISQTDGQQSSTTINIGNSNQSTSGRRKPNLIGDNEYDDSFECLTSSKDNTISTFSNTSDSSPKVPPLRIVISSSTSSRNSKDLNPNSNQNNYVVSIDQSTSNSQNENVAQYLTRNSNTLLNTTATITTIAGSTTGRITTRSQRAAALNHLTNDDSQPSRYSPEEFTSELFTNSETTSETIQPTVYLNSQNIKESNKENKDLRRRKGRGGKGPQTSLSNSASTASVTNSTSNSNGGTSSTIQSSENGLVSTVDEQTDTNSNLDQSNTSCNLSTTTINSRDYQMPAYNCYNMFQNIRKQVEKRRQTMCDSANSKLNQKAPQGFKNYLLSTGNYLLDSRNESERNVNPNLTSEQIDVPELLRNLSDTNQLIELFKEQELEREKMRVQHLIEREKAKLSIEQEILRVHNRASLAMANQSLPLSFTVLLKDEEIYNPIDSETEHSLDSRNSNLESAHQKENSSTSKNEYSRVTYTCSSNNTFADLFTLTGKSEDIGSRCRYSGRLLHSWLQDVEDKWSRIKKEILNRQRRESDCKPGNDWSGSGK